MSFQITQSKAQMPNMQVPSTKPLTQQPQQHNKEYVLSGPSLHSVPQQAQGGHRTVKMVAKGRKRKWEQGLIQQQPIVITSYDSDSVELFKPANQMD